MRAFFTSCAAACTLLTGLFASLPASAQGQEKDDTSRFDGPGHWRVLASPYTHHFHYSEEHRYVWAIGAERQADTGWLVGASYFSNSFGQPSAYVYAGERYAGLLNLAPLYFQWTAGILYGYVGQYKDKVPLNYGGFSPGAVVSLGWQLNRESGMQLNLLGDAGVMLQFSHDFH